MYNYGVCLDWLNNHDHCKSCSGNKEAGEQKCEVCEMDTDTHTFTLIDGQCVMERKEHTCALPGCDRCYLDTTDNKDSCASCNNLAYRFEEGNREGANRNCVPHPTIECPSEHEGCNYCYYTDATFDPDTTQIFCNSCEEGYTFKDEFECVNNDKSFPCNPQDNDMMSDDM
jgi:hypothetical protein